MANIEQAISAALHESGALTTAEIHNLFHRRVVQLGDLLHEMERRGEIRSIAVPTKGRPAVLWELVESTGGQMVAVDTAEPKPSLGRELTPTEVDRLILATVRGMGDLGASEDDIARVLGWAMQTPQERVLHLVFDQKLWIRTYGTDGISFVPVARV